MNSLPETYTDFFIAYWPCEGGAQPLRLGREQALAVWSSPAEVQNYGRFTGWVLQPVKVTRSALLDSAESLYFRPAV